MQITASAARPGDMVRGIGLVVEFSEPQDDSHTHLEGYVLPSHAAPDSRYAAELVLPNEHRIAVRRLFEVGDVVTVTGAYSNREFVRVEILRVDGDEKMLAVRPEGATTETTLSVSFSHARHIA